MTSKEALKKLENFANWSSDEDVEDYLYNRWGNVACRVIKRDLEKLELYESFTIPNLKRLILKLYNKHDLDEEEIDTIVDINTPASYLVKEEK